MDDFERADPPPFLTHRRNLNVEVIHLQLTPLDFASESSQDGIYFTLPPDLWDAVVREVDNSCFTTAERDREAEQGRSAARIYGAAGFWNQRVINAPRLFDPQPLQPLYEYRFELGEISRGKPHCGRHKWRKSDCVRACERPSVTWAG